MSSCFKNRAAGVQKPPPVCISKLKEQLRVIRPRNTQLALTFDASGAGLLGPWHVADTVFLVRDPGVEFWYSGGPIWRSGVGYEITVHPFFIGPIYEVRIVTYERPALPIVAGEFYASMPGYEDDKPYQLNIYEWQAQTTGDRATCRMWIR